MYLDHLKFCIVCIHGRRYVCCSEYHVVSNACDEPTSYLVRLISAHGGEYFSHFYYGGCVLVCSQVVALGQSVRLTRYHMW